MKKLALICLSLVSIMPIVFGSVSAKCDQNFYKTLRYGKQYTFRDEFNANSSDKWIWDYSVTSNEQYDYNKSTSFPEFDWTDEIVSADYKVPANKTMSVIKAKSPYQILQVPLQRSYDNLLLTYTIQYSTDEAGNHQYSHTECGHYAISRCGDGIVDDGGTHGGFATTDYGEVCDPKDESHTNWGVGGCTRDCQKDNTPQTYCGDGILQSNEDCDPGNGNFGNGCDSNCKLTTPTCTLTVNPNQGNAPLTTTINGTKPTWATYTNLSYGDGQSKANPTFSLNHTYTTVGSYSLTLTVQNNYNGQINGTRPTATCSASVQTSAAPYCGDGILQSNESCDPGNGNFGNGCDSNCKLTTPTCTLTVNPNQGNAPLTTTINGTKPTWATYTNLSYGDGQSKANPTFSLNHTYTTVGSYSLTLTVQNNYNGQINGTRPTATCSASVQTSAAPYCGDGILQSNEDCDPGNGNFGNGCDSNCKLTTPTCTLTVNPNQGNAPLTTTINGTKPTWATYTNLSYGDGQSKANPTFSLNHTYTTVGSYSLTLTVQNNYNGQINGTRPTATCSASVQTSAVKDPECNSSYNGQRLTNLVEGNYLCSEGTYSNFQYNENTHKWAWKCNNVAGKSVNCSATKPYCGDGIKDAGEVCDYKDTTNKAGWGNGGCSNSCQPITINGPECNSSYNGQRLTNLVEGNYLCSEGTYGSFQYNENTHEWTWKCNNTLGQSVNCSAVKPYCGDGIKDAGEICDYRDTTNKAGWSELGCSNTCQPITVPSGCDETFYDKLRYGRQYTFYDDFHANSSDKWLWKWVMEYNEQYDYNMSPDFPAFAWTTNIVNANYRVAANTTMRVLQATSTYPILAVPAQRAYDNLFIKYTLTYSTDEAGANKVAHSECAYYEITWCGDGVLDTEFGETCDPKDPTHTGWGNRGCDDSCQPVISKGYLDPLKTLIGSNEVTKTGDIITWSLKVTAKDGDVTNFIMSDTLPPVLGYKDYEILHKGSVDNITLLGADDNSVSWRVDGTLKEGDYVEIKLITYAKEMPKQEQKNVLCVRPENEENDKKCDDEPIPPVCSSEYNGETLDELPSEDKLCEVGKATDVKYDENTHKWTWKCENEEGIGVSCSANKKQSSKGYLDPLKTLIGSNEVSKTGDIITWSLKVTAKDGDVTNFIMSDTLPPVLGYKDYEILHKGSVDNITLLGADDNSVSWRVDGTLKEGDYVEIKLITYAKEMPKQEQKNVLCVRPENEENDKKCDDEPIPPVCSSEYNGETLDELPSEDKLCEVGKATDVKYDENTHKWTWKCENEEGIGVSCSANKKQSSKGYLDPLKTLIGSNEVSKTGDIITWSLKVTAKDGDVTNFIMSDTLPPVLGYKDYEILHKGSVDNITLLGADDNSVSWRVDGTLKEGDYVEIKLITYAKEMPKQEQKNVLCVRPENEENDKKCDDEPIPPVCSSEYNGETLDELPSEDKLCEVGKATDIKYDSSTRKWTWKCENEEGIGVNCSANKEEPSERNPDIRIKKSFTDGTKSGKVVKIDEEIAYLIEFGNRGDAPATITMIKDFLPKNVDYVEGEIFFDGGYSHNNTTGTEQINTLRGIHFNRTVQGVYIDIYGGLTLEPNSTGHIILTGKVSSDFTNSTTNFACIYLNDKQIDCDDATHIITPEEVMCKKIVGLQNFGKEGGSTVVTCTVSPEGGKGKIELNCGNGQIYTKENESLLSGECKYPSNSKETSDRYQVTCKVNDDEPVVESCKGEIVVRGDGGGNTPDNPYCEAPAKESGGKFTCTSTDKVYAVGIDCNHVTGKEDVDEKTVDDERGILSVTKTCDTNNQVQCYVMKYKDSGWETLENTCGWEPDGPTPPGGCSDCGSDEVNCSEMTPEDRQKDPGCGFIDPKCFNINNGNVSIEKTEFLPYYFNIRKNELPDYKYEYFTDPNWSKDDPCENRTIALNTMECRYIIRDPNNNIVFEENRKCLTRNVTTNGLINNWISWMQNKYGYMFSIFDDDNTYAVNLGLTKPGDWHVGDEFEWNSNGPRITDLGEYKSQIEMVEFYQCIDKKWQLHKASGVCQSNFVLTEPYTVQKTPSGNLTTSTKTLEKFKQVDGDVITPFSSYLSAMSPSDYHRSSKVDDAMKNFKAKYKKLAVSVKGNSNLQKVPGKNIYFIDKDISISNNTFNGAFTIVQEGSGNKVTIDGSVTDLNMMILTDGKIIFKGNCTGDQTVKGIFVGGSLDREGVDKNEDINPNHDWCDKGGLHIKGVLIGNDFSTLMKKSRSHIDDWRQSNGTTRYSENDLKTKVMNGASVVIEYSPSIFTQSTMPPGAEYFTTALDIYKK